jgi:1-acyl-sn-glycerol-3-phosphate acyltransferase
VNHPTVWDAFPILSYVTSTIVHTLVEEQVWSFLLPRIIFTLSNQIVLYRDQRSEKTIEDALYVLSKGESVLIAPEGERTDPSIKARARRGVARLAIAGRATVIPVGAWISPNDIIKKKVRYNYRKTKYAVDSFFPRFRSNYGFVIGKPMYLDTFFDRELTLEEYQEISTKILDRIYNLSAKAKNLFEKQ